MTVEPLRDASLRVTFVDGTSGEVRPGSFIDSAEVSGTIFEPLCDPESFRQVRLELGAIAWPNGADLAPDAMYDAIRTHGYWVGKPIAPELAREGVDVAIVARSKEQLETTARELEAEGVV